MLKMTVKTTSESVWNGDTYIEKSNDLRYVLHFIASFLGYSETILIEEDFLNNDYYCI